MYICNNQSKRRVYQLKSSIQKKLFFLNLQKHENKKQLMTYMRKIQWKK